MNDHTSIELICQGAYGDPFSVLGLHERDGERWLRCFAPGALRALACSSDGRAEVCELLREHPEGFFEGPYPAFAAADYRLRLHWPDGSVSLIDDPYRFGAVLGECDVRQVGAGTHARPYEVLGANPCEMLGVSGTAFAVWAPNASRVSVVGDFNGWDGRRHPMRLRRDGGVWELFLPGVQPGARYKFELCSREGRLLTQKADPYARQSELRPSTASVVALMPPVVPPSDPQRPANALDAPVSIYEVHLGSWRRRPEEGQRWLNWDELAAELPPYARNMGFTHIELLPISEHPLDASWGYQPIGLYAPTARFGDPAGLRRFVDRCHSEGLGVILDWVPAHFPGDAHGLREFDGTRLYENADPGEGQRADANTLSYDLGRSEVRNFLAGNALYWLERYGFDGLRVDALATMLYRDHGGKTGEWAPDAGGGCENLEATGFLKRLNQGLCAERQQTVMLAEESTDFAAVSRPVDAGGLGFHYRWNLGWMHDTLKYMARDPVYRKFHHSEITVSLIFAYQENFVLPVSHDEVAHGKGSMLSRMPGDSWQKFANLRAYYGYMWGHPGKKLLFMGCEFAQTAEWNFEQSLDWHELELPLHAGMQRLLRDLNRLYRTTPALYQRDCAPEGFEWIDPHDAEQSVISFIRRGADPDALILVVCNFTPLVRRGYRIGVPEAGVYRERINTDSAYYGGSNVGSPFGQVTAAARPWMGWPCSLDLKLPPLATVFLSWER